MSIDQVPAVLSTFGLAFFWFIGAIPAGMVLKLSPLVAALAAWSAYVAGVLLILLAGTPLRQWIVRRFKIDLNPKPASLVWRILDRYALAGLALLAPVTLGSHMGALLGLALGIPPRRLLLAMGLGALAWTILITLVSVLGGQLLP
jgi:hypothetical protein